MLFNICSLLLHGVFNEKFIASNGENDLVMVRVFIFQDKYNLINIMVKMLLITLIYRRLIFRIETRFENL